MPTDRKMSPDELEIEVMTWTDLTMEEREEVLAACRAMSDHATTHGFTDLTFEVRTKERRHGK